METIEIIGYKRANLGKKDSTKLRQEGNVPCVIYGGEEQIHFYSPMILFRELVYTPGANFVKLNIEGIEKDAILQDIQFHPVSEIILHADFLELKDDKKIKMDIPVKVLGDAPGVKQGGKILMRIRKLSLMAYPKNMPSFVEVDISGLELGQSIKVEDLLNDEYDILNSPLVSVVSVNIPRVKIEVEEEEDELEGEEGEEEEEGKEGKEGASEEKEGKENQGDSSKKNVDNKDSGKSKEEKKDS